MKRIEATQKEAPCGGALQAEVGIRVLWPLVSISPGSCVNLSSICTVWNWKAAKIHAKNQKTKNLKIIVWRTEVGHAISWVKKVLDFCNLFY